MPEHVPAEQTSLAVFGLPSSQGRFSAAFVSAEHCPVAAEQLPATLQEELAAGQVTPAQRSRGGGGGGGGGSGTAPPPPPPQVPQVRGQIILTWIRSSTGRCAITRLSWASQPPTEAATATTAAHGAPARTPFTSSSHTSGIPAQMPFEHWSELLVASPSSHAVPSAAFCSAEQLPLAGWHAPATMHAEEASHTTPTHLSTGGGGGSRPPPGGAGASPPPEQSASAPNAAPPPS